MQSSLTSSMQQPAVEIFFSYARADELLRKELEKHLKPLQKDKVIKTWHDREIPPGAEWQNEIDRHLESAQIILLLISADFLASEYCYGRELERALERHDSKDACVIPVILRSCDWQSTPFGKLQALPTDGKAITSWSNQDEAFTDAVKGIRRSIANLTAVSVETSIPPEPQVKVPAQPVDEPPKPNKPLLQPFEFQTVQLNDRGLIIDRPKIRGVQSFIEDLGNGVQLTMVEIPAGEFLMGAPNSKKDSEKWERPQHLVKVPRFYLGQTLITQGQWQALMGENPSRFKGDDNLPVDSVSWLDTIEFCEKLSQKTGRSYSLPAEAEWEYACRAGTKTPFAFGETITPEVVNYDGRYPYGKAAQGEYRKKTTLVRQLPPNKFGLYDMHGNLWEWCEDLWHDSYNGARKDGSARLSANSEGNNYKVLRGGSWSYNPRLCRSAARDNDYPDFRLNDIGFRVVSRARTL